MTDNKDFEPQLKLKHYITVQGRLICDTGLHIGAGAEQNVIMGLDNPIIKHPLTDEPYIPGSSVKGKLRSLLELADGKIGERGKVHKCKTKELARDCQICRIFGVAGDSDCDFGPGRLLVRDLKISSTANDRGDRIVTERKWENTINRSSGTAEHPRQTERVPADTAFDMRLDYRVISISANDNGAGDEGFFTWILYGLKLLEQDYLGGSGSRGYGRVRFNSLTKTVGDGLPEEIDLKTVRRPVGV